MKHERNNQSAGMFFIVIKESIGSFLGHNNFEMSVALASYGFFSIIPLLFFVAYLFGSYDALSQQVIKGIENLLQHVLPNFNMFTIKEFYFSTSYRITWGFISLSLIFVSLMSVSDSLRTAFLKIFNITREISFLRVQLINIATTMLMLALFIVLVAGEMAYISFARPFIDSIPFLKGSGDVLASLIVTSVCMVMVYIAFPPKRLKACHIVTISIITAILLVTMKNLFTHFLSFNPDYGIAFGSLKTFFIMIIWVYYSFLVILFGAEIIVNIGKKDALLLKKLFLSVENIEKIPERFINRYTRVYNMDDIVFTEGEHGDVMFFIVSGTVSISRKNQIIRTMKRGDYFGEMSMLLNAPRTATVITLEDNTRIVVISQENFETILKESPEVVLTILKEMTLRLKLTNESI
ncbi:MAG: YihY/virulence factor BrkB family protein [Proteobacteria bacterium]|nr:YihY/virulence factor BrkB family protein [Pseudomonadota bacterium]